MKNEDFDLFATLLKQRSGLVLTREKSYLLESRLANVIRKGNLKSFEELAHAVRERREETLMADIADAMMFGDTQFFRDRKLFRLLQTVLLPRLIAARGGKRQLRIWSAACATGQEAYSLAMMMAEQAASLPDWRIEIIGSDLSRDALERARTGSYTPFEIQRGLPIRMLVKYFQQHGHKWQVKDALRQMVQFRDVNLIKDFGSIGTSDIIFCRNVLDNFESPMQKRVLDALANLLALDGYLIVGAQENMLGISAKLKPVEGTGNYILSLTGK